ncbi:MAG: hypothetical protein M3512_14430 [Bacteroidota bacterium]|nr:hypothetical protein [Bacteroidota bacterium]
MTKNYLVMFSLLIISSCNQIDIDNDAPACIRTKIKAFSKESCKDGAVKEYSFQDATVYLFEPGTCGADMTAEVLDSNCNTIGHLGGIIGNTIINEEDFSNAESLKTIWER